MPRAGGEIGDIYALRALRRKEELAARLAFAIGPAEELFWRGFVQRRAGLIATTALYGGAHLVTENLTLVGAATVAGAYWGLLRAFRVPLGALIASHVAWDVWIFLIAPTQAGGSPPPPPRAAPTPPPRGAGAPPGPGPPLPGGAGPPRPP